MTSSDAIVGSWSGFARQADINPYENYPLHPVDPKKLAVQRFFSNGLGEYEKKALIGSRRETFYWDCVDDYMWAMRFSRDGLPYAICTMGNYGYLDTASRGFYEYMGARGHQQNKYMMLVFTGNGLPIGVASGMKNSALFFERI